jgi:hypothetical protein
MTARDIITELERLPAEERAKVAEYVVRRFPPESVAPGPVLRRKPFVAAMDRVFQENHDLLRRLAQ